MKKIIYLIGILFVAACTNSTKTNEAVVSNEVVDISVAAPVLNVESLLEKALDYDGKEVFITGTVTHVCKHSGKRLHLMGDDEKTRVRLEAGQIGQFERTLEGSEIIARGIFRREVIDEEYLAKWADELNKEGSGDHKSHEEEEEEKGQMNRYRSMMKESEKGYLENFWVDGLSFEIVNEESEVAI
jgi:hypothetical protein